MFMIFASELIFILKFQSDISFSLLMKVQSLPGIFDVYTSDSFQNYDRFSCLSL